MKIWKRCLALLTSSIYDSLKWQNICKKVREFNQNVNLYNDKVDFKMGSLGLCKPVEFQILC